LVFNRGSTALETMPIHYRNEPHETDHAVSSWRKRLYEIIFEANTAGGKAFDVALLLAISLSVLAVMLESVETIRDRIGAWLLLAEWGFTILFTAEYVLRLVCVRWRGATR
jgi:voltage-gated potassium channel